MARHGKFKGRPKRPPMTTPKMASPHPQRFTMQQEALNTEGHHRLWSNSNLRNKAVTFVKAGELQRSEFENLEEGEVEEKVEVEVKVEQQQDAHVEVEAEVEVAATEPEPQPVIQTPQTEITEVQKETEVEMEVQDEGEVQGEEVPEELFFFDSVGQAVPDTGLPNPTIADPDQSDETSEDEVVFTGRNSKPIIIESDIQELRSIHGLQEPEIKTTAKTEELTLRNKDSRSQRKQPKQPRQRHQWSPENDDILADYIANMDQDDDSEEEEEEEDKTVVRRGGIGVKHAADAGTEGDEIGVESSIDVLSKMHIDSKPDANTPDKEDSDLQINLDLDEDLNLDTPHTTDFDTDEDDDDDDDLDADILEQLALEYSRTHKKKGGRGNRNVSFPSASAFADAIDADPYYGFDIMDFDRPSLTKPSKGKRQPALELMLSDSDLEMHLQDVWQTDRKKKATKKKEREELRSQGVLGRGGHPDDVDLKVKYAKGMNMEELMTELRAFLMSSKQSLSLPPMTKNRRKTIHELANIVSLKSQSKGNGLTRFPILIKTSRTPGYTRKTISKVDSLLSGRKLNRRLFASWGPDSSRGGGGGSAKPRARGAGGVTSGVTYMDGDVVGGSAPEIGAGNRGRAMLEKMGWSSGTALGAQNNKGILQPVTHVVKNSRAGLG